MLLGKDLRKENRRRRSRVNDEKTDLAIIRDLLSIGSSETKVKYNLTDKVLDKIFNRVEARIRTKLGNADRLCKNSLEKALDIDTCPVTNCVTLTIGGTPCGKHYMPMKIPLTEPQISGMIKTVIKSYQRKVGKIRARRKNTVEVSDFEYSEIMEVIIKTCLSKHLSLASRYYAYNDNDLVDMAVQKKFDSTVPVKVILAELGHTIGGILRGMENRHTKRFSKQAEKWYEQYEDCIVKKEGVTIAKM